MTGGKLDKQQVLEWLRGMVTIPDAMAVRSDWARGFDRAIERAAEEIETGRFDAVDQWPSNMQHDAMMERFISDFDREYGFEPRKPGGVKSKGDETNGQTSGLRCT